MKKEYESPKVVKVEFDYTESVAACGPSGAGHSAPSGTVPDGLYQKPNGEWWYKDQKVNSDPYSTSWACRSTGNWGCYQF